MSTTQQATPGHSTTADTLTMTHVDQLCHEIMITNTQLKNDIEADEAASQRVTETQGMLEKLRKKMEAASAALTKAQSTQKRTQATRADSELKHSEKLTERRQKLDELKTARAALVNKHTAQYCPSANFDEYSQGELNELAAARQLQLDILCRPHDKKIRKLEEQEEHV